MMMMMMMVMMVMIITVMVVIIIIIIIIIMKWWAFKLPITCTDPKRVQILSNSPKASRTSAHTHTHTLAHARSLVTPFVIGNQVLRLVFQWQARVAKLWTCWLTFKDTYGFSAETVNLSGDRPVVDTFWANACYCTLANELGTLLPASVHEDNL